MTGASRPALPAPLADAHRHGRAAARWLQAMRYHPNHRYWSLGTMHPSWHALTDPDAEPGEWLSAARSLLRTVADDAAVERRAHARAQEPSCQEREWDPHDALWRTTLQGAVLETVQEHLDEVVRLLTDLGVEERKTPVERHLLIARRGKPPLT